MWRNWQTRTVQVGMEISPCRFDSCHRHQKHNQTEMSGFFMPIFWNKADTLRPLPIRFILEKVHLVSKYFKLDR